MFTQIETTIISFANVVPLEIFVFVASIVEEIIAPIPSPTVMVAAGSVAQIQEYTLMGLVVLALIGAFGKTVGAIVVYTIADKAEDITLSKFGRFFRITHEDVENFGKRLGNGAWDYVVLTVLRALPVVPSVLISGGSGLIKVPLRIFIVSTIVGTIVRDGFYLYAGYLGIEALKSLVQVSSRVETYVQYGVVLILTIILALLFLRSKKIM